MILSKRIFFVTALILSASIYFAQLSGNAQLASQSNHSGIKVKFKANPGTAVTDSTLTDAVGNYSINITGGSYNIELTKIGYQNFFYNNNQAVILTNTMVLNTVTLNSGNIVNATGTVSGSWVNTNIYLVNGDISVPMGATLTIQPGTVIKFNGNYSLTVNGVLIANANATNRIIFTSNNINPNPGDWSGIIFNNSSSIFNYCIVEYDIYGLNLNYSSPVITNNIIRKFTAFGIYFTNCSSIISGNEIYDYRTVYTAQGITGDGNGKTVIECNYLHDGAGYGIRPYCDSCIVRNNKIEFIDDPQRGYGIDASWRSAKVVNNVISNCRYGIEVAQSISPSPSPLLINNTIFSNTIAIYLGSNYATPSIIGNLITNNINGIIQSTPFCAPMCSTTPSIVAYNNVWNNANGNYIGVAILGVGQAVSQNSNGDPVDSYFNISMDPLYDSSVPPFYLPSSPCVGAGSPTYNINIGASQITSCSILAGLKRNKKESYFSVYPNPFANEFTISILGSRETTMKLFDILGRGSSFEKITISDSEIRIVTNDITSGIYFLEISNASNSKQTIKLIKQ